MEDTYDRDKSSFEDQDDETLYVDCVRLVEGGHTRKFESVAAKFDIVQYELNDGPTKPLLFYAIEHNDEAFVKTLLEMEVPLDKNYSVSRIFFCQFINTICLLGKQLLKTTCCQGQIEDITIHH
jgi:hypothetical protein